jgi:DNA-binding NtrC family response regulator
MTSRTVVLAGRLSVEHLALEALVAEFGWSLKEADGLRRLAELNESHTIAAVLFSPKSLELPWERAVRHILDAAPGALPVLCHGFAEKIDWPRAAHAGVFHSLLLPFKLQEVRQSLGFAWSAKRRSAKYARAAGG